MKKYFILSLIVVLSANSLFSQIDKPNISYEIGAMLASNTLLKISGVVDITDSTLRISINDKGSTYKIVKYSEPFKKYLLTDGIDEFVFTISEQRGKMKGYEHSYLGIFELKGKFYSVSYALNKKE